MIDASNGLAAVLLWHATARLGRRGLRERVQHGAEVAAYADHRLRTIGWPSWRRAGALAVVLRTPPPTVEARWKLLTANGLGRIICHPGTTYQQVDEFIGDLAPHATGTANDWAASPHLLNNVAKWGHTAARWR